MAWHGEQPDAVTPSDAVVDATCARLFLSESARETEDNLVFVHNRLLRTPSDLAALLERYCAVRIAEQRGWGRKPVRNEAGDPLASVLLLSGVVRADRGFLRIRNRIYAQVFDEAWARNQMLGAEVRRQRAAFRRGVVRTASMGAAVTAVIGGLASIAWYQAGEANRQRALADERLSRLYTTEALREAENGDPLASLRILDKAVQLDNVHNPYRATVNRKRAALIGRAAPRLLWSFDAGASVQWVALDALRRRAAVVAEHNVIVCHMESGRPLLPPLFHERSVRHAAFHPDGSVLATIGDDGRARIWNMRTGRLALPPLVHRRQWDAERVVFDATGRRLAVCGDAGVSVWDTKTGQEISRVWDTDTGHWTADSPKNSVNAKAAAFVSNAERVVFVALGYNSNFADVRGGKMTSVVGAVCYDGTQIVARADGRRLALSGKFGRFSERSGGALCDETGKLIAYLPHQDMGTDVSFSPSGLSVATTGRDGIARLWNAQTGTPLTPPMRHRAGVVMARFSPDGTRLVTASLAYTCANPFTSV